MKFWDTAALVPLIVDEPTTPALRRLLAKDRGVAVWMLTRVEMLSALGRLGRATDELSDVLPSARADVMDFLAQCVTLRLRLGRENPLTH